MITRNDTELSSNDYLYLADLFFANFGADYLKEGSQDRAKLHLLFATCKEQGIGSKELRQMAMQFIKKQKYRNWIIADFLELRDNFEVLNKQQYEKRLEKEKPEIFGIVLIDEQAYYYAKEQEDKIIESERVRKYVVKRIEKKEAESEVTTRSEDDVTISKLAMKVFELEAQNERLQNIIIKLKRDLQNANNK